MLRASSSLLPPVSSAPSLLTLIPSLNFSSSPLAEPFLTSSPVKLSLLHHQTMLSKKALLVTPDLPRRFYSSSFKGIPPMAGSDQFCSRGLTGLSFYQTPSSLYYFLFPPFFFQFFKGKVAIFFGVVHKLVIFLIFVNVITMRWMGPIYSLSYLWELNWLVNVVLSVNVKALLCTLFRECQILIYITEARLSSNSSSQNWAQLRWVELDLIILCELSLSSSRGISLNQVRAFYIFLELEQEYSSLSTPWSRCDKIGKKIKSVQWLETLVGRIFTMYSFIVIFVCTCFVLLRTFHQTKTNGTGNYCSSESFVCRVDHSRTFLLSFTASFAAESNYK